VNERRRVTAKKNMAASPGLGTAPQDGSGGAFGDGRLRKKERQRAYCTEMYTLNSDFASWAAWAKNDRVPSGPVHDYEAAASQYIKTAAVIKRKYSSDSWDVLTFGTNEFGQLGQVEDILEKSRPCLVKSLHGYGVTGVACGGLHSISVTDGGTVDTWGANDDGGLGVYGISTSYAPIPVKGFIPSAYELAQNVPNPNYTWRDLAGGSQRHFTWDVKDPNIKLESKYQEKMKSVSAGDGHCLALSNTGRVYFFGSYKDKEGKAWRDIQPKDDPREYPDDIPVVKLAPKEEENPEPGRRTKMAPRERQDWPIHVWQMPGKVTQISSGFCFNAAIVETGTGDSDSASKPRCVTWGLGECGELARPVFAPVKKTPEEIDAGNLKGYNQFHVDKIISDYLVPKPVVFSDGFNSRRVEKIICGGYHFLVIAKDTADGASTIFSAGMNTYGQLGHGDINNRDTLTKIEYFKDIEIVSASGGQFHSLCLDSTGTMLYGFGRSCSGQIGHTSTVPKVGSFESTPVPVYLKDDQTSNPIISKVSSGGMHSFALTSDGDIYSWGYAFTGSLGLGKTEDEDCQPCPLKVNVTLGVNRLKKKDGKKSVKCTSVKTVVGGGQHSILVAHLQEK